MFLTSPTPTLPYENKIVSGNRRFTSSYFVCTYVYTEGGTCLGPPTPFARTLDRPDRLSTSSTLLN